MEIFKLFGSIFVNTDDAENSISKTDKKANSFASTLGTGIKTAAKWGAGIATAAAGMAVAAGGALAAIAEKTRDYRTEMGKLDTAFTTAGLSSEQATSTYKSLQSVLGETDTAVEAANHLAKLCNTQEELNKWTEICTGVFATFGDSLPIEGLTEAANETAKVGQVTGPLADALNWAGVSEDAFNDSLAKCSDEQERQALITDTLNGLYSEASQKYKETNKDVLAANEAQEKITNTMAKFGAIAEPVVTMAKEKFADLLESLLPVAEVVASTVIPSFISISEKAIPIVAEGIDFIVDKVSYITDFFQAHKEEISTTVQEGIDTITSIVETGISVVQTAIEKGIDVFEKINTAIQDMSKWCSENQTALELLGIAVGTITALVIAYNASTIASTIASGAETIAIYAMLAADGAAAIAKGALTAATTLWSTVAGAATAVTTGLGAAITFLTSPIALVIIAIGAIIAIGILLYKNWDEIKEKAHELGEKIAETFENIKSAIGEKIEAAKSIVDEKINAVKDMISNIFEDIKNAVSEKVNLVKETVTEVFEGIKNAVDEKLEGVKSAVSEKFNTVKETMGTVMQAAKETIDEKLSNIKDAYESHGGGIKGVAAAFIEGVKGYYSAGYTFIDNLTGGKLSEIADKFKNKLDTAKGYVSSKMGAIKDKFDSIINKAADKIESGIEKIKSFFNFSWSLPKLKLPHFSISGEFSLNPPSIPSFGIEWYKNGGIMTQPTAFGINPNTGKTMVGGEAGPEAITPISVLQEYITEAVSNQNQDFVITLNLILQAIYTIGDKLGFLDNLQIVLDSGTLVGELAPKMDSELGTIISLKGRNG